MLEVTYNGIPIIWNSALLCIGPPLTYRLAISDVPPPLYDPNNVYSGNHTTTNADDLIMNPPPAKQPKVYGSPGFVDDNDSDSETVSSSSGFSRFVVIQGTIA